MNKTSQQRDYTRNETHSNLVIEEQIYHLHRFLNCIMKPIENDPMEKIYQQTKEKMDMEIINKENVLPYSSLLKKIQGYPKQAVSKLSPHTILFRLKAAQSLFYALETNILRMEESNNDDVRNRVNKQKYLAELSKLHAFMEKATWIANQQAKSTMIPNPVKTKHIENIIRAHMDKNTEGDWQDDFSMEDDDEYDDEYVDEYVDEDEDEEEDEEEEKKKENNISPSNPNQTNKSIKPLSKAEIQKQQAELLQSELSQMVHQLKHTTAAMHTNLKHQNKTLSELEQHTSQNLNNVENVASDTKSHVKQRRGWKRTASTWGLLILCMITFCCVFILIRMVPKRANACLFFCTYSSSESHESTSSSSSSTSSTYNEEPKQNTSWKSSWFMDPKERLLQQEREHGIFRDENGIRVSPKAWRGKNPELFPYMGWQEDDIYYKQQEKMDRRHEHDNNIVCEEYDPNTGKCKIIVLSSHVSVSSNSMASKLTNEAKERRRQRSLNSALYHRNTQKEEAYATWWDNPPEETEEERLRKLRKEQQRKEEYIKQQTEEARKLHEWNLNQKQKQKQKQNDKENVNEEEFNHNMDDDDVEDVNLNDQTKESIKEVNINMNGNTNYENFYEQQDNIDDHMRRKREFDHARMNQRQEL